MCFIVGLFISFRKILLDRVGVRYCRLKVVFFTYGIFETIFNFFVVSYLTFTVCLVSSQTKAKKQ